MDRIQKLRGARKSFRTDPKIFRLLKKILGGSEKLGAVQKDFGPFQKVWTRPRLDFSLQKRREARNQPGRAAFFFAGALEEDNRCGARGGPPGWKRSLSASASSRKIFSPVPLPDLLGLAGKGSCKKGRESPVVARPSALIGERRLFSIARWERWRLAGGALPAAIGCLRITPSHVGNYGFARSIVSCRSPIERGRWVPHYARTCMLGVGAGMKALFWVGSSREDVRAFPEDARSIAGHNLRLVQQGLEPDDWR